MGISVTSKADLRKKVLELRKNLTEEETAGWDQAICQKIKNLGLEKQYGTIYCYISVRGETGTEALIRWYLERTEKKLYDGRGNRRTRHCAGSRIFGTL